MTRMQYENYQDEQYTATSVYSPNESFCLYKSDSLDMTDDSYSSTESDGLSYYPEVLQPLQNCEPSLLMPHEMCTVPEINSHCQPNSKLSAIYPPVPPLVLPIDLSMEYLGDHSYSHLTEITSFSSPPSSFSDGFSYTCSAPPSASYSPFATCQFQWTPYMNMEYQPCKVNSMFAGQPSTSQEMICSICEDKAEGYHFGAISCAACGAFFRRSISDHKVYSCPSKICIIRYEPTKRGGACRFCRFCRCLASGMNPQEVRAKRVAGCEPSPVLPTLRVPYQPRVQGESVIDQLMALRRDVVSMSTHRNQNIFQCPVRATFDDLRRSMEREYEVFCYLLLHNQVMIELQPKDLGDLPTHWTELEPDGEIREMFLKYYLHETLRATQRGGGIQLDRICLPDGSTIDLDDDSLNNFFVGSPCVMDPNLLGRLCSSCFRYIVRTVVKSVQLAHLDEAEFALFFYLTLASAVPPSNLKDSTQATKHKALKEIARSYDKIRADFATKIGNVILLLGPLASAFKEFRELLSSIEVCRISMRSGISPKKEEEQEFNFECDSPY